MSKFIFPAFGFLVAVAAFAKAIDLLAAYSLGLLPLSSMAMGVTALVVGGAVLIDFAVKESVE